MGRAARQGEDTESQYDDGNDDFDESKSAAHGDIVAAGVDGQIIAPLWVSSKKKAARGRPT